MSAHPSGLSDAFERVLLGTAARLIFPENRIIEGANLNELQRLGERRDQRIGNMVAKDGDVISGGQIALNIAAGTATMAAGRIYVAGDVREVAAATISGITGSGTWYIGVKLQRTLRTHLEDPTLLGLMPGSEAEGEPTAAQEIETIVWARDGDTQPGVFARVYEIVNGAVLDQPAGTELTNVMSIVGAYDYGAHKNYVVNGCEVTALGKRGNEQGFSIAPGEANVLGIKRRRVYGLSHWQTEAPDLEIISAEPQTFTGPTNGSTTVTVNRAPIESIQSVVIQRRLTENRVRGAITNGSDQLTKSSVVTVESVTQGATTYVAGTDYNRVGDFVSWAPGGAEPASGSTYSVTYIYTEAVTPTAVTDTTFNVSGGVNNTPLFVSYRSKLPRVDLLCLDQEGGARYVSGISSRSNPVARPTPDSLLKLCEIRNDWMSTPVVSQDATYSISFDEQRRWIDLLLKIAANFDRSPLENQINARDASAKRGIFTDAFLDDSFRDFGEAQTAATTGKTLELAVDAVSFVRMNTASLTLPYTEEVVFRQELWTRSMRINPYANVIPFPAGMKLDPAIDFWTEEETVWTSPVTREFVAAPKQKPGTTTVNERVRQNTKAARFLRQIPVTIVISGFAPSENLATLTFDDINVKPGGTQTANLNGQISLTITIPAKVPAGMRKVRATGAAGSFCEAGFHGAGTIEVTTMRRVNLVTRAPAPPVIINNTYVVNNVTNVTNVTQVIKPETPVITTPPKQNDERDAEWDPNLNSYTNQSGFNTQLDIVRRDQGHCFNDPLAQTFALQSDRSILGCDFLLAEKGSAAKGIRVQLVTTFLGLPTNEVLAEAFIPMSTPQAGQWIAARFDAPVFVPANVGYAFVFMTDDNTHAVRIAQIGDVDPTTQKRVTEQAYPIGALLASSNRQTWTPVQDADMAIRIVAARYTAPFLRQQIWTGSVSNISDITIRAPFEIPTATTRIQFEVVRASGEVITLNPDQPHQFSEFVSETLTIRAVLLGNTIVAPLLHIGAQFITGRIRASGTYISRRFKMQNPCTVYAVVAAFLPVGSGLTVEVDEGTGTWSSFGSPQSTEVLSQGWTEPQYRRLSHAATEGRLRLTLTGTPAARPSLAELRAWSV